MTKKKPSAARVRNTLKFKKEAVRLVEGSQTVAAARTLGVLDQTLFNWGKVSLLAALDAGICQPDAVRENMVCGSAQTSKLMTQLWDTASKGKVIALPQLQGVPEPNSISMMLLGLAFVARLRMKRSVATLH